MAIGSLFDFLYDRQDLGCFNTMVLSPSALVNTTCGNGNSNVKFLDEEVGSCSMIYRVRCEADHIKICYTLRKQQVNISIEKKKKTELICLNTPDIDFEEEISQHFIYSEFQNHIFILNKRFFVLKDLIIHELWEIQEIKLCNILVDS